MEGGPSSRARALVAVIGIGGSLALTHAACGSSGSSSAASDAGDDAAHDVAAPDSAPDASVDGATDADAASDAPFESSVDAAPDAVDAPPPFDAGPPLFAKSYGDGAVADATSVAVDANGNVIVVGYFQGALDFGTGTLTATGMSNDVFVAKLSPTGTGIWAKRFGDAQSQAAFGVAVDAAGNVYVTGYNSGSIDFGLGAVVSAGAEDIFVAKLDGATGNGVWSKGYGDASDQAGYGIGVDHAGGVVVTGYVRGTTNFGAGPLVSAGGADVFLLKLDGAGATQWAKIFGDASDQFGTSVAFDATNDVVFTGEFAGAIDIGLGVMTSAGMHDVFLGKLTATGATTLLAKRFGDAADDLGDSVAIDTDGSIYLSGGFSTTIDFGVGALGATGVGSKFLAKLDATGAGKWSKSLGVGSVFAWTSVAVDHAGDVVLAGEFEDHIDFGAGSVASAGGTDVFVGKYTTTGALVWGRTFGDSSNQVARAVGIDGSNDVALVGAFQGAIDFGAGRLSSTGTGLFVAALRP